MLCTSFYALAGVLISSALKSGPRVCPFPSQDAPGRVKSSLASPPPILCNWPIAAAQRPSWPRTASHMQRQIAWRAVHVGVVIFPVSFNTPIASAAPSGGAYRSALDRFIP